MIGLSQSQELDVSLHHFFLIAAKSSDIGISYDTYDTESIFRKTSCRGEHYRGKGANGKCDAKAFGQAICIDRNLKSDDRGHPILLIELALSLVVKYGEARLFNPMIGAYAVRKPVQDRHWWKICTIQASMQRGGGYIIGSIFDRTERA